MHNKPREVGKATPATLVRNYGAEYYHIPTQTVYEQKAIPSGKQWEPKSSGGGSKQHVIIDITQDLIDGRGTKVLEGVDGFAYRVLSTELIVSAETGDRANWSGGADFELLTGGIGATIATFKAAYVTEDYAGFGNPLFVVNGQESGSDVFSQSGDGVELSLRGGFTPGLHRFALGICYMQIERP